jgi:hypothetical protein
MFQKPPVRSIGPYAPPPPEPQDKLSPLLHLFVTVIAFIICALSAGEESVWTSVLLFLPVLAQVIGSVILHYRVNRNRKRGNIDYYRWNLSATSACVIFYCFLWFVYSQGWFIKHPNWLQMISLVAVALIAILLCFVGIMTAAFIMAPSDVESTKWLPTQCRALRAGIKVEPLWAIALFFVLFLGVAYLFGFALAFHDKSTIARKKEWPALHMVNLHSQDDAYTASVGEPPGKGGETPKGAIDQAAQSTTSQAGADVLSTGEQEEFCFYFEEVKASLTYSKENCTTGNPKRSDAYPPKPQIFNSCSLQAIVEKLRETMEQGGRVKITLLGHSDNEPIKFTNSSSTRYLSNYELSESRAQNVRYEILLKLRESKFQNIDNIEWVVFPAADEALNQINRGAIREDMFRPEEIKNTEVQVNSNRTGFADQIEKYFTTESIDHKLPPQEKRVVIATIEPISENPVVLKPDQMKNLTADQHQTLDEVKLLKEAQSEYIAQTRSKSMRLMDYMYFSLYTITTTGYGDIVPTTAYAKFVTSLANICEVLFLVVFFNALISIRGDRLDEKERVLDINDHQTESEHDATDTTLSRTG